jgi:hypothetical protein
LTATSKEYAAATWRLIRHNHSRILVTGPAAAVDVAVATLVALEPPVCAWRPGEPLPPPTQRGTLVLRDVERSTFNEQRLLSTWLLQLPSEGPRVVSTTTGSLWGLVTQGQFSAALYYRLNTLLLDVGESIPS